MKANYQRETDAENRERAIALLEIAKQREAKKKTIPLRLNDRDNTIFMVSQRLNEKQREKLRKKRLAQLKAHRIVVEPF